MKTFARIVLCCSIGLFLVSLWQPAFSVERGTRIDTWDSVLCLCIGWLGLLEGKAGVTWIANPLLLMAWITFWEPRASFIFSIPAAVASTSFLLCTQITANEAGHVGTICQYHLGYWLWLSSTIVMLAGNGIQIIVLYGKPRPTAGQPNKSEPQPKVAHFESA